MTIEFKGHSVEVTVEKNRDGSRFITRAVWLDGPNEDKTLDDDEINEAQAKNEGEEWLNGMWRG